MGLSGTGKGASPSWRTRESVNASGISDTGTTKSVLTNGFYLKPAIKALFFRLTKLFHLLDTVCTYFDQSYLNVNVFKHSISPRHNLIVERDYFL